MQDFLIFQIAAMQLGVDAEHPLLPVVESLAQKIASDHVGSIDPERLLSQLVRDIGMEPEVIQALSEGSDPVVQFIQFQIQTLQNLKIVEALMTEFLEECRKSFPGPDSPGQHPTQNTFRNISKRVRDGYDRAANDFGDESSKRARRRGGHLPPSAVETLKAWLFEHVLEPFPTDEEKRILASESSLTVVQVNNWFLNARRRYHDTCIYHNMARMVQKIIAEAAQDKE